MDMAEGYVSHISNEALVYFQTDGAGMEVLQQKQDEIAEKLSEVIQRYVNSFVLRLCPLEVLYQKYVCYTRDGVHSINVMFASLYERGICCMFLGTNSSNVGEQS